MFISRNDLVGEKVEFLNKMGGLGRAAGVAVLAGSLVACGGSSGGGSTENPDPDGGGNGNGGGTTETLYNFNSNSEKTCEEGSSPEELKQTCVELQTTYGSLTYKTVLGYDLPGELTFFVGDDSKIHVHIVFYYEGKPYNAYNDLTVTRSDGGLEIKQLVEGESAIYPLTYYFDSSTEGFLRSRRHDVSNKTLSTSLAFRHLINRNTESAVVVSDVFGPEGERCVTYEVATDSIGIGGEGEICENGDYASQLNVGTAIYSVLGNGDAKSVSTETTNALGVIPLDSASTEAGAPLRYLFDNNFSGGLYSSAELDFSRKPEGQVLFKMANSFAPYVKESNGEALVGYGNVFDESSYKDLGIDAGTQSETVRLYEPYLAEVRNAPGTLRFDLKGPESGFGVMNTGTAQGAQVKTEQAFDSDYRKRIDYNLQAIEEQ